MGSTALHKHCHADKKKNIRYGLELSRGYRTQQHTGCFKTNFTTLKAFINLFRRQAHTGFYHGYLRLNVTFTGSAECFEKNFTKVFQMLLCESVKELFTHKGVQTSHH
jgi:sensor histidine kinase YesM